MVCGHYGVFSFRYPNFRVEENTTDIRMYVHRSGGGYGNVTINYFIKHFTTNDSDLVATARYTTLQQLDFSEGVIERSFKITILDDNIVEEDEVFQVVLEVPEGGGSVGAQFRANVTIVDNDLPLLSAKLSKLLENTTSSVAGEAFTVHIQAVAADGRPLNMGGDAFVAVIENDVSQWTQPRTSSSSQRNYLRTVCHVTDLGNGIYTVSAPGIPAQGEYQLRVWHAFPRSIRGEYFTDGFFDRLAVWRLDHQVNFTWGTGRLIPRGRDYITVRWSGAVRTKEEGLYRFQVLANDHARLWIDGELVLDHWHENAAYLEPPRALHLLGSALYEIVLEYREVTGDAYAVLLWSTPSSGPNATVVPQSHLYTLFEVDRSPVRVTITSAATAANSSECTGEGLFGATALQSMSFSVCPRDRFGNLRDDYSAQVLEMNQVFSSQLTWLASPSGSLIDALSTTPQLVFNPSSFCFDGSYSVPGTGRYRLDIGYSVWRGDAVEPVAGSPFLLEVQPDKTDGPQSVVAGLPPLRGGGGATPLALAVEAGRCHSFNVTARDAAQNLRLQGGDAFTVSS